MKVLFLVNYRMDHYWEVWKTNQQRENPEHHMWGVTKLHQHGIDVDVLPYEKYPALKKLGYQLKLGDLDQQLRVLFNSSQYDLVYSAGQTCTILLSLLRSVGVFQKPILVKLERPFKKNLYNKILLAAFARGHDKLLCLSSNMKNNLRDDFGIPEEKLVLLEWGADLPSYELKDDDSADSEPAFIMSAGNTSRDYTTLVKAFTEINYPLRIYCSGSSAPNVSDIPSNVTVQYKHPTETRTLSFKELLLEYKKAYAIAIPLDIPKKDPEYTTLIGLTSLLDAMAMGKAVVMTKHKQTNIDIEKEGIGLWVEPGDVKGWQQAVSYLIENPSETIEMGNRGRRLCESKYNLEIFSSQLAASIKSVLK